MRIYNKVVIDTFTGAVEFEDSYDYNGPILECKGGGPSGTVVFPTYMTKVHQDWMTGGVDPSDFPEDFVGQSMAEVMADAMLVVGDQLLDEPSFTAVGNWLGFGAGGWTHTATADKATHAAGTVGNLTQTTVLTVGQFYQVSFTLLAQTAGGIAIFLGAETDTGVEFLRVSVAGNYSFVGKATATTFTLHATDNFAGTVSECEVRAITPASPYATLSAFNPATLLTAMQTRYDTFDADVAALNEETDWDNKVTKALTRRTTTEFPDDNIDTRLVTINAAAVAAAKLAATDAIDDAKVDLTAIVNQAMLELDTDSTTIVNSAVAAAKNAIDNSVVQDMIDQFELRQKSKHFRTINRFAGAMADVNAVQSSAYIFGMAQLESEFNRDVADFDKEMVDKIFGEAFNNFIRLYTETFTAYLRTVAATAQAQLDANNTQARIHVDSQIRTNMQIRQIKDTFLMQSIAEMTLMLGRRIDFEKTATSVLADINRMRVVALKEQTDVDASLDINDALWDLKVYQYGANMLGSIGGGSAFIPELPSSSSSALGGAFSGAGTGASIGTAINPGAGTAIGAGIGAVVGAVAGALE